MAQRLLLQGTGGVARMLTTRSVIRPVTFGFNSARALSTSGIRAEAAKKPESEIEPKAKALSIIDALPGNSVISKTGYVTVGAALATAFISKEIYVVNEETLVLVSFVGLLTVLLQTARHPFNEWVKEQGKSMTTLLTNARESHHEMVNSKIEETAQLRDVVDLTKNLFSMSKEMAEMEAKIFELKQKAALSQETKSVLDSWVRHESALREREQRLLSDRVIERARAALDTPKVQNQLLAQALADVEKITSRKT